MREQRKQALLPKLRFPEFRDAGEWEEKPLKAICVMQAGKFVAASDIFEDYNGDSYPCYGGNGLRGYTKTHTHSGKYPLIGRQGALCGNVNLVNGQFHATEHAVVVTPKEGINVDWLFYTLDLLNLNRFATGQAQPGLSVEVLDKVPSVVPQEPEQQKIADCLSSIDELITLEVQKLATLKAHKKGLMQQFFPAKGETLPRLRFPEFRDAGEWEERMLGQLGELVSGLTYSPDDIRNEGLLVLRSSNVQNGTIVLEDNVFVRPDIKGANPSKPNDILICVRNGSKSLIGKNALIPEVMPPCTHGAFMTVFRSKSATFIFQLFQTEAYEKQVDADLGATINSINGNQLRKYKFHVPVPEEQQRIADCFSSIDELIIAQTQKLATLKTHKKGLMQQLFPSVESQKNLSHG
ncbi:restriction endonuclease subunit S [Nitrosomonas ureae]|uniref:Type I restriction enzyme, S subunit n=1 Tax=Nitrosomonas ureae TaxID=44577 RepID=A0A1H5SEH9_9PROT|nr:restriction endonuclease subunit S [Nitrosomonas ureae]SEF48915.1 type I restriction enzyme, S subunit [Nitrosomonas ureae]